MKIYPFALSILLLSAAHVFSQQYTDSPYLQDLADKYLLDQIENSPELFSVDCDRNKQISVLSENGLLQAWDKKLVNDLRYRPLTDEHIIALQTYREQFIYLTGTALLSNAWAGRFYVQHGRKDPSHFVMGNDFSFLLAESGNLLLFRRNKKVWEKSMENFEAIDLLFDEQHDSYVILTSNAVFTLNGEVEELHEVYRGHNLTAMALSKASNELLVGTGDGLIKLDRGSFNESSMIDKKLPANHITCIKEIDGRIWIGSTNGAFVKRPDGKYDYYASKRWLVDNQVKDISSGPDGSVLVLTEQGLSKINFEEMTLAGKAAHFQEIQRLRHIRYGFSSEGRLARPGDPSSMVLGDTDNDGLWTSMYLAGELFRYAATKSKDALQNAYEAFEAMERLTEISGISGFPARTYEIDAYQSSDTDPELPEENKIWQLAEDGRWRWKSTTSSDESCGHFFVYALFAEIVPDRIWRDRAIHQIKIEMDHIIKNDWYLVTWNGEITQWGRWNPDYVNSFPISVGDRRLNSTLILAFLQTAYHFTGEKLYREKAYELMEEHGYMENVIRPATVIGQVEGQFLSDSWNHSDDEMYFLTVPALVKYAFTNELRDAYFKTIRSHWEIERSEKNPLWNFIYALVGGSDYDLEESIWWLKEFPMDLISWNVDNSKRLDLEKVEPNFRKQEYSEVLPRDERPMHLHNSAYINHGGHGGKREYPPYIFLLPYWAGRYVEAISPPE